MVESTGSEPRDPLNLNKAAAEPASESVVPPEPTVAPEPTVDPEPAPTGETRARAAEARPTDDWDPDSGYRRIRRSKRDKVIGGLAGGIGHYIGIDPVLIRLAFVALVFAGGVGILLYIIGLVVVPEETEETPAVIAQPADKQTLSLVLGILLVAGGIMLLAGQFLPALDERFFWPLVLIAIGAFVIVQQLRK